MGALVQRSRENSAGGLKRSSSTAAQMVIQHSRRPVMNATDGFSIFRLVTTLVESAATAARVEARVAWFA